ncbi:YbaB/EbfC family nucleoid-associated protein [Actinophytocola oryzae]|uniref:DNA-binding protein YbaB n=1 Tax=Actinophytocola oryzae TaxID=502181 RepID=A0A4R7W3I9_9PSEU|nr:YbaB/EbfC family nucleoid-associated protein [Actinophytocola oryzae]TDV57220.1 DNA-binding protein YbaB [Actinophytocola oryzae]
MDDRVLNPDDARQRLEAWKGRIDKLAADTQAMSDRFQQLQVTRRDRDGMTEVTVDSSGSLVGLKLTREIDRSAPDVIAATIMSTIREAKAELAERTQEIVEETIGTDSPAGRAIAERVGDQLRGTRDDESVEVEQPEDESVEPLRSDDRPTHRVRGDDDDDDNELNLWR